MQFYSHKGPDKLLIDHLVEVKNYALSTGCVDGSQKEALELICLCHDFGKFTTFFQDHLFNKTADSLSHHGFISAVFAAFSWFEKKQSLQKHGKSTISEDDILALIIYSVILHHHGNIEDIDKNLPKYHKGNFEAQNSLVAKVKDAYTQIEDIKRNKEHISCQLEKIGLNIYFRNFLDQKDGFIEQLLMELKRIEFLIRGLKVLPKSYGDSIDLYFIHQTLYSLLVWGDKLSAANYQNIPPLYSKFDELIEARELVIKPSANKSIQDLRQKVFETTIENVIKNKEKDIFSITTPTGTGKTLAGVFAALKLKDLLNKSGRIIYALPFTSIIDQNYNVVYSLFENLEEFEKDKDRFLLKNHHLTNVEYVSEKKFYPEEYQYEKLASECFIENWTSGFVVTTFVQLIETLISNRNRMLKKFHALFDSVILLDEIQAIDVELLPLVEAILKKASKILNCKIIFMTATKPLIFDEATELAGFCDYSLFNRTKLIPIHEEFTSIQFVDYFENALYEDDKSYLIVTNTIKESLEIYNGIKNKLKDKEVIYLSANLVPAQRKEVIKRIEQSLKSSKPIVVSTQVVEAGVDLDFDCVIRDIAPMDSIIQCAGRCNRHSTKDQSDVLVVRIKDDKGVYFATRVYGNTTINISRLILDEYDCVEEKDYKNLIEKYYAAVKTNKSFDKSNYFLEAIKNLNFQGNIEKETSISRFSLIQERGGYVSVILRLNDEIEEAYQQYLNSFNIKDYYKRREIYLDVKNLLFDYTISVPVKYAADVFEENRGILSLPYDSCQRLYNPITGFVYDAHDNIIFA